MDRRLLYIAGAALVLLPLAAAALPPSQVLDGLINRAAGRISGPPVAPNDFRAPSTASDIKSLLPLLIGEADAKYGFGIQREGIIDYEDVIAIFQIESRYQEDAIKYNDGGQGNHAYGMGQMLASTAADMGFNPVDLLSAHNAVDATVKYLIWITDFLGRPPRARPTANQIISAYNNGVGNVQNGRLALGYLAKHKAAKLFI